MILRNQPKSATFSTAQTGAILLAGSPMSRILLRGVLFASHADTTVSPMMRVKVGGEVVVEHPGVSAGGGLVAMGLDVYLAQGDDVTFDCSTPTGGSVSVSVFYSRE